MKPFIEVTVQQGGGGFMKHACRTPLPDSRTGHFYGQTVCNRHIRPLFTGGLEPRAFTATSPDPKPAWDGTNMNRYCAKCIRVVTIESGDLS